MAECIGYEEHPYDALMYRFEPGETVQLPEAPLRRPCSQGLSPLVQAIGEQEPPREGRLPRASVSRSTCSSTSRCGWRASSATTRTAGSLDLTVHPFEISFTRNDVRITTRVNDEWMPKCLFGAPHETGHALYEQFCDPAYTRTPLATDLDRALRRRWGQLRRAREPIPPLRESRRDGVGSSGSSTSASSATPSRNSSTDVDAETFWRAVNRVEPGPDSGRVRRAHLRLPHHAPRRAGGGAHRREPERRRPARGVERQDEGVPGAGRTERSPRGSPGRPLVVGPGRHVLQLHDRQRHGGAALRGRDAGRGASRTGWPPPTTCPCGSS